MASNNSPTKTQGAYIEKTDTRVFRKSYRECINNGSNSEN